MKLLLTNARIVDPSHQVDLDAQLLIENGLIAEIGNSLSAIGAETLDLQGAIVAPGFVDMHVHLREPGKEDAETIATGTAAAAAGGFTAVACMPNTQPVIDSISTIELILQKSRSAPVQVLPIASVTMGENGSELTPMAELQRGGAVAFSDDGRPVSNSLLMRQAMEAAKRIGVPIIDHCEDPFLFQGGSMNEGPACAHLGHRGIPSACEEIMVARNILLSKLTGARIHMAHMSTVGSMKLIRDAKNEGLAVTAEVTPHHFTLTDEAVAEYGSNAKMNPPLRTSYDVHGVLEAIADGTVDVIASDHAPHTEVTKKVEFAKAAFGILGLETSLSLGYDRLVSSGIIPLRRFIELYSLNPAKILGLRRGIYKGAEASLTVFHTTKQVTVKSSAFLSKSRNTPFEGWSLRGSPWVTIYRGTVVWKHKDLK